MLNIIVRPFIPQENIIVKIIVEPRFRWLRHLLLFLLLVVSYNTVLVTYIGNLGLLGPKIIYLAIGQFLVYLGTAYLNIYVLVPRLLLSGRYILYFVLLWLVISIVFFWGYVIEHHVSDTYSMDPGILSYANSNHSVFIDYISEVLVMGMCYAGTTITIFFRKWLTDGKRMQQMEAERQRHEILKIKDTVNPVFLMEILTVAADKTTVDNVLSADILTRLSHFLRYRLYDSNRPVLILNSEVAFLRNYLSMVKEIRSGFSFSITSQGALPKATVPSSILINIVDIVLENTKETIPSDLEVRLTGGRGKNLNIQIITMSHLIGNYRDKISGLINRMLEAALYGSYSLGIDDKGDCLDIELELKRKTQ